MNAEVDLEDLKDKDESGDEAEEMIENERDDVSIP